ncbi:MAG: GYD domain-containing protein [Boseongicola sp.]|nr:GYD domain-containing protein [Boseongicola sp.]
MPKYMTQFNYSLDSVKGMVSKPQDRRAAAEKIFAEAGGKIETMYYCFGDFDGVVITDFPSDVAAASAILAVGSSGAFANIKTTVLIPMKDSVAAMEAAKELASKYAPPAG